MTAKHIHAQAHHIIDQLTASEPLPDFVKSPDGWRKSRRGILRGEHWALIVAELETGASAEAILADLAPTPVSAPPDLPVYEADEWAPASPEDRTRARTRISAIRQALKEPTP